VISATYGVFNFIQSMGVFTSVLQWGQFSLYYTFKLHQEYIIIFIGENVCVLQNHSTRQFYGLSQNKGLNLFTYQKCSIINTALQRCKYDEDWTCSSNFVQATLAVRYSPSWYYYELLMAHTTYIVKIFLDSISNSLIFKI